MSSEEKKWEEKADPCTKSAPSPLYSSIIEEGFEQVRYEATEGRSPREKHRQADNVTSALRHRPPQISE